MNIVDKKEFDEKIIGDNTLELYYNDIKPDTKLYTKTVTFTRDDFGMTLDTSNLEEIDIPPPPPPPPPTAPPITEIPHQIASGADGWCVADGKTVHQDVPGCGRICSSWEYIGSKNKGSWGLWGGNQNGIDCPAAKLDQVWKLTGGSTSGRPNRELAVGKVSESGAMDLTGGFKWYYYKGSYFSGVNSFSGKNPTKQGENVTDFSSKHKATGGHLRNDGNEDNYAVKWEGFFAPKKTGSHKFWTESDDMSYLYVNNITVVNNGGLHGMVKKNGSINLTAGEKYPIKIYFSEKGGGDELKVWFQGPDISSAIHNFSGYMVNDNTVGTSSPPPPATPTNQDCEGHWVNDPTGRSLSKAQKNYKTVKYVVTKPKSGNGKDCMWAFTRKNPHVGATDVTRNWAGYAFGNDQWTSEVVTDGQKGEVFNYQNTKGYRMNDPMHGEEFENMYEWKQNYLRFCMRKPNVAWDYSKNISGRNKDIYTDAYGTIRYNGTCRDDDD